MANYYQVIVSDGEIVDNDLRPIRPSCRCSCNHRHRTREAAERCQAKLLNYRTERGTNSTVCSAKWYNSRVVELTADGRYPLSAVAEA